MVVRSTSLVLAPISSHARDMGWKSLGEPPPSPPVTLVGNMDYRRHPILVRVHLRREYPFPGILGKSNDDWGQWSQYSRWRSGDSYRLADYLSSGAKVHTAKTSMTALIKRRYHALQPLSQRVISYSSSKT